jgi:hypothetical protein
MGIGMGGPAQSMGGHQNMGAMGPPQNMGAMGPRPGGPPHGGPPPGMNMHFQQPAPYW